MTKFKIRRKLFAVFCKRAYGTLNTPNRKLWLKDINACINTAKSLIKYDSVKTKLIDKDSVGESIRQATLNLHNSIKASNKWENFSQIEQNKINKARKIYKIIKNNIYNKNPDFKAPQISLSLFNNNNNKTLTGKLYNGEKYNNILDYYKEKDLLKNKRNKIYLGE